MREFRGNVPAPLEDLVCRSLALEPAERPSAEEFAVALEQWVEWHSTAKEGEKKKTAIAVRERFKNDTTVHTQAYHDTKSQKADP